jgi:hypothetical protein
MELNPRLTDRLIVDRNVTLTLTLTLTHKVFYTAKFLLKIARNLSFIELFNV